MIPIDSFCPAFTFKWFEKLVITPSDLPQGWTWISKGVTCDLKLPIHLFYHLKITMPSPRIVPSDLPPVWTWSSRPWHSQWEGRTSYSSAFPPVCSMVAPQRNCLMLTFVNLLHKNHYPEIPLNDLFKNVGLLIPHLDPRSESDIDKYCIVMYIAPEMSCSLFISPNLSPARVVRSC